MKNAEKLHHFDFHGSLIAYSQDETSRTNRSKSTRNPYSRGRCLHSTTFNEDKTTAVDSTIHPFTQISSQTSPQRFRYQPGRQSLPLPRSPPRL